MGSGENKTGGKRPKITFWYRDRYSAIQRKAEKEKASEQESTTSPGRGGVCAANPGQGVCGRVKNSE